MSFDSLTKNAKELSAHNDEIHPVTQRLLLLWRHFVDGAAQQVVLLY